VAHRSVERNMAISTIAARPRTAMAGAPRGHGLRHGDARHVAGSEAPMATRRDPGAGRSPGSQVLTARLPVAALRSKRRDSGAWGGPHSLTVAGAAAGWRGSNPRGTAFPFHPPRGIRGGHLRGPILPRATVPITPAPGLVRLAAQRFASACYNLRPFNDFRPHRRSTGPGARL
jgi:hypothetical protein